MSTEEKANIEIKDYTFNNKEIFPLSNMIYVLPSNYDTETDPAKFYYPSTLLNFLKLAKKENLPVEVIGQGSDYNLSELRSGEWFSPLLLISTLYASQNPDAVSVALNVLSAYLFTYLSGKKDSLVNVDILITDEKTTKLISYKGTSSGFSEIKDAFQQTVSKLKEGE